MVAILCQFQARLWKAWRFLFLPLGALSSHVISLTVLLERPGEEERGWVPPSCCLHPTCAAAMEGSTQRGLWGRLPWPNTCVFPKLMHWSCNLQCDNRKCGLWEVIRPWGRKALTNLDSISKAETLLCWQRLWSSQGYDFSSGHVWMWELDHKES